MVDYNNVEIRYSLRRMT